MPNRRPHIAIHVERNADGSHWSAWRCTGEDVFAYGYSAAEAYAAWAVMVAKRRAEIDQKAQVEFAQQQRDEGQALH